MKSIAFKIALVLCLIAVVIMLASWVILTYLFGEMIEFICDVFCPLGLNPLPMIEWFFSVGRSLESKVLLGHPLAGYYGRRGVIDGLPVAYPVTSHFGYSMDYFGGTTYHTGVDMSCPEGSMVVTPMAGQVTFTGYSGGYGYLVIVENQGVQSFTGHLSRMDVQVGDEIEAGTQVGLSGNTGWSTGPHLHWETRVNGVPVDPLAVELPGSEGSGE